MRYEVSAYNTATASENKIHDDAVAAKLGFVGGLVPGVDVYAYLCHIPAERWGAEWIERGTMQGRFASPVYDGDDVVVEAYDDGPDALSLTLYDSKRAVCATGRATLPPVDDRSDDRELIPLGARPADRPPASAEVFAKTDVLASLEIGFHAGRVDEYLDNIREGLPLFRSGSVAHPAWLLRHANYVLSTTVKLGPWIHVESECRHLGLAADGDRISIRARVLGTSERKGHRFVDLDVQWVVNDERPIMRARHTAIYEPRGVAAATA